MTLKACIILSKQKARDDRLMAEMNTRFKHSTDLGTCIIYHSTSFVALVNGAKLSTLRGISQCITGPVLSYKVHQNLRQKATFVF